MYFDTFDSWPRPYEQVNLTYERRVIRQHIRTTRWTKWKGTNDNIDRPQGKEKKRSRVMVEVVVVMVKTRYVYVCISPIGKLNSSIECNWLAQQWERNATILSAIEVCHKLEQNQTLDKLNSRIIKSLKSLGFTHITLSQIMANYIYIYTNSNHLY